MISPSGASADVKATNTKHDMMVQFQCTDWDFMLTRAEANGQIVMVDDGKVTVQPPTKTSAVLTITYGKDLYIGHAAYKVGDGGRYKEWDNPSEIPKQIQMNRGNPAVSGSIYFSTRSLKANKLGVADSLSSYYQHPVLLPENKKTFVYPQRKPRFYRAKKRDGGIRLRWKHHRRDAKNMPLYYVVYRFDGKKVGNFDDPRNILTLTGHYSTKRQIIYVDKTAQKGQYYTYVIKPVNKLHQEGASSRKRRAKKR